MLAGLALLLCGCYSVLALELDYTLRLRAYTCEVLGLTFLAPKFLELALTGFGLTRIASELNFRFLILNGQLHRFGFLLTI